MKINCWFFQRWIPKLLYIIGTSTICLVCPTRIHAAKTSWRRASHSDWQRCIGERQCCTGVLQRLSYNSLLTVIFHCILQYMDVFFTMFTNFILHLLICTFFLRFNYFKMSATSCIYVYEFDRRVTTNGLDGQGRKPHRDRETVGVSKFKKKTRIVIGKRCE